MKLLVRGIFTSFSSRRFAAVSKEKCADSGRRISRRPFLSRLRATQRAVMLASVPPEIMWPFASAWDHSGAGSQGASGLYRRAHARSPGLGQAWRHVRTKRTTGGFSLRALRSTRSARSDSGPVAAAVAGVEAFLFTVRGTDALLVDSPCPSPRLRRCPGPQDPLALQVTGLRISAPCYELMKSALRAMKFS